MIAFNAGAARAACWWAGLADRGVGLANIMPGTCGGALLRGNRPVMFAIGPGGIWADKLDHIAAVTNFIVTPLTFLSGSFYSTDVLPEPFRTFAHYNPVFFLIDGFRYGFIGAHDAPLLGGALASLGMTLVLCWVCWALLKSGYRLRS